MILGTLKKNKTSLRESQEEEMNVLDKQEDSAFKAIKINQTWDLISPSLKGPRCLESDELVFEKRVEPLLWNANG